MFLSRLKIIPPSLHQNKKSLRVKNHQRKYENRQGNILWGPTVKQCCQVYIKSKENSISLVVHPHQNFFWRFGHQGKLDHKQKLESIKQISVPPRIYIFLRTSNPKEMLQPLSKCVKKRLKILETLRPPGFELKTLAIACCFLAIVPRSNIRFNASCLFFVFTLANFVMHIWDPEQIQMKKKIELLSFRSL